MKTGIIFIGIGFELVGIVLTSLYFGSVLDTYFYLGGLGIAATLLLGLVGWVAHIIFLLIRMQRANDQKHT